tara:strand:- start:15900 stop:16631 length:732 start_codon:yes stop_codon:yes gene_type:complete
MTLNIIGIGLHNHKDISLKGLELIKESDFVYLEFYTSKLGCDIETLEKLYGKKIIIANRELVETKQPFLEQAKDKNVSLLIIGDVFSATTHMTIMMDAKSRGIGVNIVNNASILNAIGIIGLELYKFGKTTSIPFHNEDVKAPIKAFKDNQSINLHTLFLLDLDPLNNSYLSIKQAAEYLINNKISKNTLTIGCARLGSDDFTIKVDTLENIGDHDYKDAPYCLIIPSKTIHFVEEEALEQWK